MPNIKSAEKRLRQSEVRRDENRVVRSRVKNARRSFMDAALDDKETSVEAFRKYCSVLDKAVKTGVIKRNTAMRRKTRASNRMLAASRA
ncbi:MAG: 30S ribosomal protein S20 [Spartobacteria bacterium]|nr:30S ribosomal protein S20 [Spartobacteria bacterium]